jgi:hypothetical protein
MRGTVKPAVPKPKLKPRASFFRRHERLFSLLGAVIVFSTFIVKDAIREQLRDFVTSLNSAQDAYIAQENSAREQEAIQKVPLKITEVSSEKEIKAASEKEEFNAAEQKEIKAKYNRYFDNANDAADSQLDRIGRLVKKMSERDQYAAQINALRDEFHKLKVNGGIYYNPTSADLVPNESESRLSQSEWWKMSEAVCSKSNHLVEEIVKRAEAELEVSERRYARLTWITYALYALGWGLALVGRLYGGGDIMTGD